MRVRSLGQEDPLKEGMATHSSILAWRIPMDRGAWRATDRRVTESHTQLRLLNTSTHKMGLEETTRDGETSQGCQQLSGGLGFSVAATQGADVRWEAENKQPSFSVLPSFCLLLLPLSGQTQLQTRVSGV